MALLLALFALLLLSAIGLCMVLASTTETRIDANYGGSLRAYYAARSGLEEARDRMKIPYDSTSSPAGLADKLPKFIAGNANGVLYILNPANGETVDPGDPANPYFDDQLCHDYNSGVAASDSKCMVVPGTPNWNYSVPASAPLGYKWTRITMKTNRIAAPYFVDGDGTSASLDTRVCWDGQTEQLSPGATSSCDANGMQQVYMLTTLAMVNGTRKLLRAEVTGPSIRPPGAVTMEVGSSTSSTPVVATFNNVTAPSTGIIPLTSVDGRVHDISGNLSTASCSPVSALATNSTQGTSSLQTSLNNLRGAIVQAANSSCNADGSSTSPTNICTPALAWVRGTGTYPKFTTTLSASPSPSPTPAPIPLPTPSPTPSPTPTSNSGSGSSSGGHDGEHKPTPTPTPTPTPAPTPSPTPTPTPSSTTCGSSTQQCYTSLDLSSPSLSVAPLFGGNSGNSGDPAAYQAPTSIVVNETKAVLDYIAARKASGTNYYELPSTSLDPTFTYGSKDQPAVLVITDSSLKLNNSLTGVGILVVPNDFEINAALNWTGIVVVHPSPGMTAGQLLVNSGAKGSVNGALMLQTGAQFVLTTNGGANRFAITYSCDAIDVAMGSQPLKVVAHSEASH